MNVAAYLHPERLLVCFWQMDHSIPVIHAYKELNPSTDVNFSELGYTHTDVIVHSSDTRLHWFPVDSIDSLNGQHAFEGSAWFEESGFRMLSDDTCSTIIQAPTPMHASIQARQSIIERCGGLAHEVSIHVDIDLDIQAAIHCTQPRVSPWLLIGRRGALWQATLVSSEHLPIAYSSFSHDTDYSNDTMVSLILRAMQDRYAVAVDALMLYGDNVTADNILSMRQTWHSKGIRVARLQPFSRIRSVLDTEVEQRMLKRAHVVAPLAAVMLRDATPRA